MSKTRRASLAGLVALLLAAGVTHFVKPDPYVKIVPRFIDDPDAAVFWSGVAEVLLAAGLVHPRTRRSAAWAAMAFLVGVFPANVQHALDARSGTTEWWLTRARLPIQPLLIWWAYSFARTTRARADQRSPQER